MAWLRDPSPAGLLAYLTILALASAIVVLLASPTRAQVPVEVIGQQGPSSQAVAGVEEMIAHLVKDAGRHPARRAKYRAELAREIVACSESHGPPPELVTAMMFRESSCRKNLTGPGGERGLMQTHPYTIRFFDCDMSTMAGQVDCGCVTLAYHHDRCGSDWRAALSAYGSRNARCKPKKGSRLMLMVNDRFALAARLKTLVLGWEI